MLVRLSLFFSLILACSACFQMSRASRDSDEEEWGAKWGTDEQEGDKTGQPEKKQPPKPAISEKDRKESFIPLPPPSPMEGKQPARPATPKTMKPAPPPPPVEEPPPPAPVMYPAEAEKTKPVVPDPVPDPKPPPPPKKREVIVTPAASPASTEPLFMLEVVGGVMMIPRGTRFQPGGGVGFGLNLGKLAGWKGLYLTADVDVLVGERQLYSDTYLLIDGLIGIQGRIPVWKLKIVAGLGAGLRYMLLTGDAGEKEPELGFGGAVVCGVEVPITDLLSAVVLVDGRYMKEPEFGSFHLTSMFSAGVVFLF